MEQAAQPPGSDSPKTIGLFCHWGASQLLEAKKVKLRGPAQRRIVLRLESRFLAKPGTSEGHSWPLAQRRTLQVI